MIPTLLITFREVIEAALIVATILGMLVKLNLQQKIKTVWAASVSALAASFLIVYVASIAGTSIQKIYSSTTEGILYIISALFVTWAVFFLHTRFGRKKMHQLETLKHDIVGPGLFLLTFTAVMREGMEIALFLSTIYLTSSPAAIVLGFTGGILFGVAVSILFFHASIRIPVYWAFRVASYLLILTAGNLLAQGVSDFPVRNVTTIPTIAALTYIFLMHRWVFVRSR